MRSLHFYIGSLWVGFVLSSPNAAANSYYVQAGNAGGTGTSANPFPTVQQAANVAVAGDTVIIENGTYPENVVVENSGTKNSPITFRSKNNRQAVLYSMRPKWTTGNSGPQGQWVSFWVTVQGIKFDAPLSNGTDKNLFITTGWDFEDCTIQGNIQLVMQGYQTLHMGNITIRHCIFQDCYACSLGGWGGGMISGNSTDLLHDVLIQNCIIRRSNLSNTTNTGWDGGVDKFLWSKNIIFDGLISYDNNGISIWFDTNNQNFKVINCTIFGNHSGYFYGTSSAENLAGNGGKPIWNNSSSAGGIDNEANPGPALIQNNVIYSNVLGTGVTQNSSGNGHGVTGNHLTQITHNIFADNLYHLWYEAQVGGANDPTRGLGATLVSKNTFYAWDWLVAQGGATTGSPGSYDVIQTHNAYPADISKSAVWGDWDFYKGIQAKSLGDMKTLLHLEDGTSNQQPLGAFPSRLKPGIIYASPTLAEVTATEPREAPALSELTTPASSIDLQLSTLPSNQALSEPETITVFGHTPLVADDSGNDTCEVYDLQGRWVELTVLRDRTTNFQNLVLPYASLKGTTITVDVTWKSPYRVSARFPAQE